MARVIPTRTDLGTYEFSVELDGAVFIFRFQFNTRDQSWFFDLLDIDSNPIRQGLKCVTNFPLLRLVSRSDRPPGELFVIDSTGQGRRAGLADLGGDLSFIYTEESQTPASFFGA